MPRKKLNQIGVPSNREARQPLCELVDLITLPLYSYAENRLGEDNGEAEVLETMVGDLRRQLRDLTHEIEDTIGEIDVVVVNCL